MAGRLDLLLEGIKDFEVVENLRKIREHVNDIALLSGDFEHFEISSSYNVTNRKFPHGLGFRPKDLIQTSLVGTGAIVWNYVKFDQTNIDFTTSGTSTTDPLIVRFFVGRYAKRV
jgi:hypothetical protein